MIDFFKKMLGGGKPEAPAKPVGKPPLPVAELEAFKTWFLAQTRPAVALIPHATVAMGERGSRLGGPVWLAEDEAWPTDAKGVPLEFMAQLDLADFSALQGYPKTGVVQFFVGRNDLYGADFDDPAKGARLVRRIDFAQPGAFHAPPPLVQIDGVFGSEYSPFQNDHTREKGIALRAALVEDRIDCSIKEASDRLSVFYREGWALEQLYEFVESDAVARPLRHHSGGYPAYTQNDVHDMPAWAPYDHVLLRLTSDEHLMWGDVGECVFLIRSADLAEGSFGDVAYSWDCG